jgi:hypothetical protein
MSNNVEILTLARGYVEKGWTQGWVAADKGGQRVDYRDEDAVCWCSLGAIWRAVEDLCPAGVRSWMEREAEEVVEKAIGNEYIGDWNDADGRTKGEVLAAFDRAIELAKSQEVPQ